MLDILDGYPVNHKHVVEGVYLEINVFYAFDAMVGNRCIFNGNGQIIAEAEAYNLEHFRIFIDMENIGVFVFCFSCQGGQDFGRWLKAGFVEQFAHAFKVDGRVINVRFRHVSAFSVNPFQYAFIYKGVNGRADQASAYIEMLGQFSFGGNGRAVWVCLVLYFFFY